MYIELDDVNKTINGNEILKHINVRMESGHIYGLSGKNGSGKTMLMRVIAGLMKPTSGKVIIEGKELGKDMSFPDSIGVLIENPAFIGGYTGYKNLEMISGIKGIIGRQEIIDVLQKVGLDARDKRKYRKYSLGMKQRLGIACAIMEKPDIIILDEPMNAIDGNGVELVHNLILEQKRNGKLVILACHDESEMSQLADVIYMVREGAILKK